MSEVQTPGAGTTETPAPAAAGATSTTPTTIAGGTQETQPPTGPTSGNQTAEAAGQQPQVPEKYEFTLPDGITIDPTTMDTFTPLFKELKLTNEQAQKLVSAQAEIERSRNVDLQTQLTKQHDGWVSAVTADPELGGAKLEETKKFAQSAVARFGTPQLKEYLNQTGLGSHPELVRMMTSIGRAMAEDTFVTAKGETGGDRLAAMYPSMNNANK